MRLFVLDDEPDVLEVIHEQLKRIFPSDEIIPFRTHKEMLEHLQQREVPDCIICDINMPEGHGLELREELIHAGAELSFVFITGFDEDNIIEDDYTILAKPLADDLLKKEVLRRSQQ